MMNAQLCVGTPSGRPVPSHSAASVPRRMFWFWLTTEARPRKNPPKASVVMIGSPPSAMIPPCSAPPAPEKRSVISLGSAAGRS